MRKTAIATVAILALVFSVAAQDFTTAGQSLYECIYRYDAKALAGNGAKEGQPSVIQNDNGLSITSSIPVYVGEEGEICTFSTILQIGPSVAKFQDYTRFKVDSLTAAGAPKEELDEATDNMYMAGSFFEPVLFQGHPEGRLTSVDLVLPAYLSYEEPLGALEWTVCADTLTVCGYVCTKAVAEYGGRTWTAWYTPEIPAMYGPWKLQGLPGLILAANDSEGEHSFSATTFRRAGVDIIDVSNPLVEKTTREKYLKSKAAVPDNPMQAFNPGSIRNVEVKKGKNSAITVINGIPVRMGVRRTVPLELK